MSPRELAAYRAGLLHASHLALIAAMMLELRDDAAELRQRSAIEALRGLAEGLKVESQSVEPSIQAATAA